MMRILFCFFIFFALLFSFSCSDQKAERAAAAMTGGSPAKGKVAIDHYGCASCHIIPGVRGPRGLVGPPLTQISQRAYIGGVLTNTPENMIRWLQNPHNVDPKTAMPDVGLKEQEARDIASYLYTLR